jgi:hypothetical protein
MQAYGYLTGVTQPITDKKIEVSEQRLQELIRSLLPSVDVNERWYRENNTDVDEAINAGNMASARDHYIVSGYFEDRLPRPIRVDEAWYLNEYPDVREAIRVGTFASAFQHFMVSGYKEGRMPQPGWSLLKPAPSR